MTVNELRDYLAKYVGAGYGDSPIEACDKEGNPLTETVCITGAVFLEVKDGDSIVVLQTE